MDFLAKNKIIVGAIVVIALGLLGFFVLMSPKGETTETPSGEETINAKPMKPEDIGLTLTLSSDKHNVNMEITNLEGIKSIEYELDYNALVTDEGETNDVPRGVLSTIDVKPGETELSKEILLGTCSSGKCKYDNVTSDIKLILKINFTNGEVGSIEASIPFGD